MIACVPSSVADHAAIVRAEQLGATDPRVSESQMSISCHTAHKQIRLGTCVYPLTSSVTLDHSWWDGGWVCWAEELGMFYIGKGDTVVGASDAWARALHVDFQRLYSMRPFEMTADERGRWARLVSVVDIAAYQRRTPLSFRGVGCVRYGSFPYPTRIRWLDGRVDTFGLDQAPPELAGFRPGQWIEAVTERDRESGRLIRITHVQRIPTVHTPTSHELDDYWSSLQVAEVPERDIMPSSGGEHTGGSGT